MALELRKEKSGRYRKTWYGRYEINGRRHCVNLGIRVQGVIPKTLREIGDSAFERSRAQAQAKLDSLIEEARTNKNTTHLLEKLYELKTGSSLEDIELTKLPEAWLQIPRSKRISSAHAKQCSKVLQRFMDFVGRHAANVRYLSQVNRNIARAFLKNESDRGIASKTYNDILKLLRSAFSKLLNGTPNPFDGIPSRSSETVFRKPYTSEELARIIEVAKEHPFIRPIIIMGMTTAMRRGDCCLLQWKHVDLDKDFICVKTAKTGHVVEIPILPLLREELLKALPSDKAMVDPNAYVFPKQAVMYLNNSDGITWRVRQLLKKAGLGSEIQAERVQGVRKASVRDFHSFRVTWITLALSAGVPLELVQRVTGHQTTNIVLKHYFQPDRENFRQALYNKMPDLMTSQLHDIFVHGEEKSNQ